MSDYNEHLITLAGGDDKTPTRLEQIQARASKAADMGAWSAKHPPGGDSWVAIERPKGFTNVTAVVARNIDHDDAEFIANAPADVAYLLAKLAAVRALADAHGKVGFRVTANDIRATLDA